MFDLHWNIPLPLEMDEFRIMGVGQQDSIISHTFELNDDEVVPFKRAWRKYVSKQLRARL
jgi:hypothetical protein